MQSMHASWLAVPHDNEEIRLDLAKRYDVTSIPSVVIVDLVDAKLIDNNGKATISAATGNIDKVVTEWQFRS